MPYKWHKTVRIFDFAKITFSEIGGDFPNATPFIDNFNINIKVEFSIIKKPFHNLNYKIALTSYLLLIYV